jgi:hypothetical protein
MKNILRKLKQRLIGDNFESLLTSIILGFFATLLVRNSLTSILLAGKSFDGRNLPLKIILFLSFLVVFVLIFTLLQRLIAKVFSKIKLSIIEEDKIEELIECERKPSKAFCLAMIVISVGILSIFVVNHLIGRIDTENWKLTGLDILPVMEPIGNDFRVGLYYPAENLVASRFKAIGPDGSYPSIYPPLVSVFSLPYLLFDAQTAYIIHVAILFILNILVLLIATLMVKELFLDKTINNSLTSFVLSTFLFFVISFFNFSSYSFLFSMERGNVDIIAMFFLMLSMWVLVSQPKKLWLQVILLAIATHFKIYPAALFLILFYYHGKKLILPTLTVNLILLFILGPKIATSFIQSLTSGGGGAGLDNSWTWVGNHAAYAFAESLTWIYSQLSESFMFLWIIFMLIPFAIWILGMSRIIRKKYSPNNAILILMISIPLMEILPTISMDYRLIILSTSFLLFIGLNISQILRNPSGESIIELLLILFIMFFVAKPYTMDILNPYGLKPNASYYLNNKYIWVLALEGLMVWNIVRHHPFNKIKRNNPLP